MHNIFFLCSFLLFLMMSCTSADSAIDEMDRQPLFFDVRAFFDEEIAALNKKQPQVRKTLDLNGVKEEFLTDSLDFSNELSLFLNSEINKVSWRDSYQADTTLGADQHIQQTRYVALDDKLQTRLVVVEYKNQIPSVIRIVNETKNIILAATQELVYEVGVRFSIDQTQQLKFMTENIVRVEVTLIP
ncbi:MAG: hypothetical protein HRU40_10535 [Saprospiraceae bacterium]|nr:hypothetical protein [Saprospiraceae bacterium]